jgi:hypothetical protein
MNHNIREVLIRYQYRDQIWYEVITMNAYYEEKNINGQRSLRGIRSISLRRQSSQTQNASP